MLRVRQRGCTSIRARTARHRWHACSGGCVPVPAVPERWQSRHPLRRAGCLPVHARSRRVFRLGHRYRHVAHHLRSRTMVTPGVSFGTSTMLCCRCRSGASGAVLPMTMKNLQRSRIAPEIHHLRPLRMYSSPACLMISWILVASELATSGSVMAKAERISPSSRGCSHWHFCSGVPNCARISMLPVSGGAQLKTSEAQFTRPMNSARDAYSRLLRPAPYSSSGKKRFQSPSALAIDFSSSRISA